MDLMDNAVALPTTPQHINYRRQVLFTKKRPHAVVGPMKGGRYHSSANMIVSTRVVAGRLSAPLTSGSSYKSIFQNAL